jgi:hypothetical protein
LDDIFRKQNGWRPLLNGGSLRSWMCAGFESRDWHFAKLFENSALFSKTQNMRRLRRRHLGAAAPGGGLCCFKLLKQSDLLFRFEKMSINVFKITTNPASQRTII